MFPSPRRFAGETRRMPSAAGCSVAKFVRDDERGRTTRDKENRLCDAVFVLTARQHGCRDFHGRARKGCLARPAVAGRGNQVSAVASCRPGGMSGPFGETPAGRAGVLFSSFQLTEVSVIEVPVAAMLRPIWPVRLTVCRWIEPDVPPTRMLAPTPAPTVASAVAPW